MSLYWRKCDAETLIPPWGWIKCLFVCLSITFPVSALPMEKVPLPNALCVALIWWCQKCPFQQRKWEALLYGVFLQLRKHRKCPARSCSKVEVPVQGIEVDARLCPYMSENVRMFRLVEKILIWCHWGGALTMRWCWGSVQVPFW